MNKITDILKLFISFFVFYFASFVFVILMEYGFNIDIESIDTKGISILELIISLVCSCLFIILHFDIIKFSFKNLKDNGKRLTRFISAVVIGFLFIHVVELFAGYIESILFFATGVEKEVVNNQQIVEQLLKSAPLITMISACILAPIEEELLFRGAVGKVLKNKKVFITVSGLIFGLAHVTDSVMLLGEVILIGVVVETILNKNLKKQEKISLSVMSVVLIFILFGIFYYIQYGNLIHVIKNLDLVEVIGGISYVFVGCAIAYLYQKNEKNILINMAIHASVNIFAVLLTLSLQ